MQEYVPHKLTTIDLVLFDASHLYTDCRDAYQRIESRLAPDALILVHDTGDWYTGELPPQWAAWKGHRATYLEEDRRFVRYLRKEGYSDITFGTNEHLRHGYTVLMKPQW